MKRLRRNEVMHAHQAEFSPVLFDMLFGLLIFLGLGAFFDVQSPAHFMFSVAAIVVVAHWWMKYKAAGDTFGIEVNNSALNLLFGIAEIALLQIAMIAVGDADYGTAVTFFALPLLLESVRALLWRFFGSWRHSSAKRVRFMEQQLEYTVFLNLGAALILGFIVALTPLLVAPDLVVCFIFAYAVYVLFTYQYEMIDVKLM